MLSRHLARCFQGVFKTSWKTKNCYAEDVLMMSSREVLKTKDYLLGCLQNAWRLVILNIKDTGEENWCSASMGDASKKLEKKDWSVYSFLIVWDNKQKVIKNAGTFKIDTITQIRYKASPSSLEEQTTTAVYIFLHSWQHW